MTLDELITSLSNTPYLFIGSGLSRRYLGLPNWNELLTHFSTQITNDEFSYERFQNKALQASPTQGVMPKIAELIENEFNEKWFTTPEMRTNDLGLRDLVHSQISPFKVEVASYLKSNFHLLEEYQEERDALASLSKNSIRGIITTNYDTLLEDLIPEYQVFTGQKQLIFSITQGIGEIYKIHGSVTAPETIVINQSDYEYFNEHCSYLASKLLTIFMEYPIIFLGYSLSDSNIQNILMSISECLDDNQLKQLGQQMIFIEYDSSTDTPVISDYSIKLGEKILSMRKIALTSFLSLYTELAKLKTKVPVSVLRRFKEDIYKFVITNNPTEKMKVTSLENNQLNGDDLVLAIGRVSEMGIKGLSGISSDEWYYYLVMDTLDYDPDELLQYAYPKLNQQNSYRLPAWKYVVLSQNDYPEIVQALNDKMQDEKIISNSIKRNRKRIGHYSSVMEIWEKKKQNISKAAELIAYLLPDQINVDHLELFLKEVLQEYPDLKDMPQPMKSNIRRLIKIWDVLKWKKELID